MKVGKLDSRYFPLLLDVIDQSIFTIDRNGKITSFNAAAEKLTGYVEDEVIGRRCSEIFQTELCGSGCPLQQTIQDGHRVIDRRVRIRCKDGHTAPISLSTAVRRLIISS